MIDNIILLITGTLHQRAISELIPKCHPLGSFEQMEAIHIASTPAELYNAVLVDTPLGRQEPLKLWLASQKAPTSYLLEHRSVGETAKANVIVFHSKMGFHIHKSVTKDQQSHMVNAHTSILFVGQWKSEHCLDF